MSGTEPSESWGDLLHPQSTIQQLMLEESS